ncbi:MAG: hypothetical protein GY803_15220 [Chloroflexi bacterium]|nr:hypothetical protein [Chloroflexota bacterium]
MKTKVIQAIVVPIILVGTMFWFFTRMPSVNALTCTVPGSHAAIQAAVDDLACNEINVASGTYVENVFIDNREVQINGAGMGGTIVDGNAANNVFEIKSSSIVTLTQMSVTNGKAGNGGGIRIEDSHGWLEYVRIVENEASSSYGGGIANLDSEVYLSYSEVISNSAETYGGGIYNAGGTAVYTSTISGNRAVHLMNAHGYGGGVANQDFGIVIIQNSTVNNNVAQHFGGGVYNSGGTVSITTSSIHHNGVVDATSSGGGVFNSDVIIIHQSAIYSNVALADAGGIRNSGNLQMFNSTLSDNSANGAGGLQTSGTAILGSNTIVTNASYLAHIGGIWAAGGTVDMANNIIANHGSANDCKSTGGTITSVGHNLDSDGGCFLTSAGDLPNENPLLGSLQNNGGPTLTHALLPDSPAIDAGLPTSCSATDQRGWSRVGICDIGSYERGYDLLLPLIMKES